LAAGSLGAGADLWLEARGSGGALGERCCSGPGLAFGSLRPLSSLAGGTRALRRGGWWSPALPDRASRRPGFARTCCCASGFVWWGDSVRLVWGL